MPRPRNRPGKKDGDMTDSAVPNPGASGGTGAFTGDLSTNTPILVRPAGTSFEFSGMRYYDYNASPLREDKAQVLFEPIVFSLVGHKPTKTDTKKGESNIPFVGYRRASELWANVYLQLRYQAESVKSYRHLPATITTPARVHDMVMIYMKAVSMLTFITCVQKLAQFDRGHRSIGIHASKVSRGRVDSAWRSLTSIPMWKGFHDFAVHASTPVMGMADSAVLHRMCVTDHIDYTWGQSFNVLVGNATPIINGDAFWTNAIADVETIIQTLSGLATYTTASDKTDLQAIVSLMRMLDVPTNHTTWRDVQPLVVDVGLHDQRLFRGAFIGKYNSTLGTDRNYSYPLNGSLGGMLEVRGRGTPKPTYVAGMEVPWLAGESFVASADADEFIYGAVLPGTQGAAAATTTDTESMPFRAFRVYNYEDGWVAYSQITESSGRARFPDGSHQYVSAINSLTSSPDVKVNDSVDFGFYMPQEDVAYHYLSWLSGTLGVPYVF